MEKAKITKDVKNKRLTIERRFAAPRSRVWRAWTTEEILVKWWGPKDWPATSASFDFRVGGHWHYYMTGPDGTRFWCWLNYLGIQEQTGLQARDFSSDENGQTEGQTPLSHWDVKFQDAAGPATMVTTVLSFSTEADLNKIIEMGFESGYPSALDNLDAVLTEANHV